MITLVDPDTTRWWPDDHLPTARLSPRAWQARRADGARVVVKRGAVHPALADVRAPQLARVAGMAPRWHSLAWQEGESLAATLARGPVPVATALRWMDDVLAGLGALHDAGLVHRDVKPANLLLGPCGAVTLVDFELACAPGSQAAHGSPASSAPEQWRGNVTARSDLFAAGVLLYRLLAGRHPFPGAPFDAMRAILAGHVAALPPSAAHYETVVRTALAAQPSARFADAAAFRAALRAGACSATKS